MEYRVCRNNPAPYNDLNGKISLLGLGTMRLPLRDAADQTSIAAALHGHPALSRVIFPGLTDHPQHDLAMRQMGSGGTMIALEVAGGKEAAFAVLDRLRIIAISNNLGDAKSIVTHPATTTHSRLTDEDKARLGITPGLLRLSVGLEDARDLTDDLLGALQG